MVPARSAAAQLPDRQRRLSVTAAISAGTGGDSAGTDGLRRGVVSNLPSVDCRAAASPVAAAEMAGGFDPLLRLTGASAGSGLPRHAGGCFWRVPSCPASFLCWLLSYGDPSWPAACWRRQSIARPLSRSCGSGVWPLLCSIVVAPARSCSVPSCRTRCAPSRLRGFEWLRPPNGPCAATAAAATVPDE